MKFDDFELAFDFVSMGQPFEHSAYISKITGETYYHSEFGDSDEIPDDIYENDDYVEIPHKNDLDLGRNLVFQFVEQEIPKHYEEVRSYFSHKGAYSRYKDFLEGINMLDKWYEFEARKTKAALLNWCEKKGLKFNE
jgi:hypothetical protein